MNEIDHLPPPGKFLLDPYEDWAKAEGVPVHRGVAVDLLTAEVKPWARFDLNGAFVHLDGRDDFLTVFVIELPANSGSARHQHTYEQVCYVLSGSGATEFEAPDGHTHVIEWGPKSLFALPMNARYRHRNISAATARFAAVSDLRYLFNLYRSEPFIFGMPTQFAERHGGTEAIADLAMEAPRPLTLAKGTISSDLVELAPGTYGVASRQMFGAHYFGVEGEGYMLAWEEGAKDFARMPWRHGVAYAAPGMNFRQQFNVGNGPARYLDVQLGSQQYPTFRYRKVAYGDTAAYAAGHVTIPLGKQDPCNYIQWLEAIAGKGVTPRM